MPKLSRFDPPADQDDFLPGEDAEKEAFLEAWSANVRRWTKAAILGNPWSAQNDQDRDYYFDPISTDIPADSPTLTITWPAFPGRLNSYYPDPTYTQEQRWAMADSGQLPTMPKKTCPPVDMTLGTAVYTPTGPRGWLDEYCEWSVTRDDQGDIVSVMFSCENPEYWMTLWQIDPDVVLRLYQELVGSQVQESDLVLKDAQGNVVVDPSTGRPAYNPLNIWNYGPERIVSASGVPVSGGAIHLTSSPNTLGAEIYLAAAATILRESSPGQPVLPAEDLVCCAQFGRPMRNSDPHIGQNVNYLVFSQNVRATLANPVGLYIQDPDFSDYQLPSKAPQGVSASQFWRLVRGKPGGFGLHAVFEVPANYGFKVSDILINNHPIQYASQIAETFEIGLHAVAFPNLTDPPKPPFFPCPDESISNPLPQATQIQDMGLYHAYNNVESQANEEVGSIPVLCVTVQQGTTTSNWSMLGSGPPKVDLHGSQVTVPEGGVEVKILKASSDNQGNWQFQIEISVAADAVVGDRSVVLTSPIPTQGPPTPGLLTVVPAANTSPSVMKAATLAAPPAITPTPVLAKRRLGRS